jgi:hypothetical protein
MDEAILDIPALEFEVWHGWIQLVDNEINDVGRVCATACKTVNGEPALLRIAMR